jgi:hypothetical protein
MNAFPRGTEIHFPNHRPIYTVIDLTTEDFRQHHVAVMTLLIHIFGPVSEYATGQVEMSEVVKALDERGYLAITVCKSGGIALGLLKGMACMVGEGAATQKAVGA